LLQRRILKRFKTISERFDPKIFLLLISWYIIPVVLGFFLAQITPIFRLKYVLFSSFGLFLLIGYIVSLLRLNYIIISVLVIIILYAPLRVFSAFPEVEEDWKSVVSQIKEYRDDNTAIAICAWYKYRDFAYYYNIDYFKDYQNTTELLLSDNIIALSNTDPLVYHDFNDADKIIYVRSHDDVPDPNGNIKREIHAASFMIKIFLRIVIVVSGKNRI